MGCTDLGAALASANKACARPATRRWVLADQADTSRVALGSILQANLTGIPLQDSAKRHAHVAGIYIDARLRVTSAASAVAVSAHALRSIYQNIQLMDVTGHQYLPGTVDGRDLIDDVWVRYQADQSWPFLKAGTQTGAGAPIKPTPTADYSIPVNANTTANYHAQLYYPFQTKGKGSQLEGLIPLAALQRAGSGALQILLGNSLLIPASTGLTLVGFINAAGNAGIDIWLDVVYLDQVVVDAPWQLQSYTRTETSLVLNNPERVTQHASIRFHENDDTNGQSEGLEAANNGTGLTLSAAGWSEFAGFTTLQAIKRGELFYMSEPSGALARANAKQDLPVVSDDGTAQIIVLYPFRSRATAPAGPISLNVNVRSGDFARYLHYTVGVQTRERVAKILASASCNPCGYYAGGPNGELCNNFSATSPVASVVS